MVPLSYWVLEAVDEEGRDRVSGVSKEKEASGSKFEHFTWRDEFRE